MQEQNELNSAELEFEQALRSIPPSPAHLNPTTAAFLAGQLSTRRRLHRWQSASAALLLLGAGSHFIPHAPPTPLHPQPVLTLQSSPPPFSNQSLLMLQQTIQKNGLNGLPATYIPDSRPLPTNEKL